MVSSHHLRLSWPRVCPESACILKQMKAEAEQSGRVMRSLLDFPLTSVGRHTNHQVSAAAVPSHSARQSQQQPALIVLFTCCFLLILLLLLHTASADSFTADLLFFFNPTPRAAQLTSIWLCRLRSFHWGLWRLKWTNWPLRHRIPHQHDTDRSAVKAGWLRDSAEQSKQLYFSSSSCFFFFFLFKDPEHSIGLSLSLCFITQNVCHYYVQKNTEMSQPFSLPGRVSFALMFVSNRNNKWQTTNNTRRVLHFLIFSAGVFFFSPLLSSILTLFK